MAAFITVATLGLFLFAARIASGEHGEPNDLTIVEAWNDDAYPYWQATITHASQRTDGVLVTYVYVGSATRPCNDPDIRSVEKFLPAAKIATLTAPSDLCAVDQEKINLSARRYIRRPKPYETARMGIVSVCGTERKVFHLPEFELDEAALERKSPQTLNLMHLQQTILESVFGKVDISKSLQELKADKIAEFALEALKPAFWFCSSQGPHPALPAEVKSSGNALSDDECDWAKFQHIIAAYRHPPRDSKGRKARIVNRSGYELVKYEPPEYPSIFVLRGVQGSVDLDLTVDEDTGTITDVFVVDGPDHLRAIAKEAAKHWQFEPKQKIANPVRVSVNFEIECGQ
jgi:TonB family protein